MREAEPKDYEILVKKLKKVYKENKSGRQKIAVDVSFGVNKGQIFGILGANGAGKTSLLKMLAGEIISTSGESFLVGLKISQNLDHIRKNIGYCPQKDTLVENLTVKEQLELFYDLRCLPKKYKQGAITKKINEMNLQEEEDKRSGALSEENKRKLSIALAMIGNPSIILLDEPTLGMNSKARRLIWKIISDISREKK